MLQQYESLGMKDTNAKHLLDSYDGLLIDAYGVLVNQQGPIPHALAFMSQIVSQNKPFVIATNDASRLPLTIANRLNRFGFTISPDQILCSGELLQEYFVQHNLTGCRCIVLGPEDSRQHVARAGGEVVPAELDSKCEAIVVCDEEGYPFLETLDTVLSLLYRHIDLGQPVHLILPNPDFIYPRDGENFGFTSGAPALLLEAALRRRYGPDAPTFRGLGKPHPAIFHAATKRLGSNHVVMIGDQLETDIQGALGVDMSAALVLTGVSPRPASNANNTPTYVLPNLR